MSKKKFPKGGVKLAGLGCSIKSFGKALKKSKVKN